jgi:predicted nucleotidyltransferase
MHITDEQRTAIHLTDDQLNAIIAWAEKTPKVQAVKIFGSVCKGKVNLSDVDLAVIMTEDPDWAQREDNYLKNWEAWNTELTAALGLSVDVFSLDPPMGPEVPAYVAECSIELWRRS